MIEVKIKRLWNGLADLRDYQIDEAVQKNQSIRIICEENGETMTLNVKQLETEGLRRQGPYPLKHGKNKGGQYYIVPFEWNRDRDNL